MRTRRFGEARELLTAGVPGAGVYAEQYRAWLAQLSMLEKAGAGPAKPAPQPLK